MENTLYQNEMSEKQQTINSLKDELSKARAESKIKMSYDKKQTKTKSGRTLAGAKGYKKKGLIDKMETND